MIQFKYYINYNCKCRTTDYKDYILVYIYYELLEEIIELFNLDETMLIENELFK